MEVSIASRAAIRAVGRGSFLSVLAATLRCAMLAAIGGTARAWARLFFVAIRVMMEPFIVNVALRGAEGRGASRNAAAVSVKGAAFVPKVRDLLL